ncbi:MAG TPA: rhodanese-like domain-containing protein [Candidatus Brocadiia bacterium]|nr:rhodanese-like domain-containing protein [Candidatus Brocadiia bacterium]
MVRTIYLVAGIVVALAGALVAGQALGQCCGAGPAKDSRPAACSPEKMAECHGSKVQACALPPAGELTAEEKDAQSKLEAQGIGFVSGGQLSALVRSGQPPIIVDVLPRESYVASHVKGAINIPVAEIKTLAPKVLPDKTATIVVYCGSFKCGASVKAAQALKELGYTNVLDFKGGLAGWTEAKLPLGGTQAK